MIVHKPVLLQEVLTFLVPPAENALMVDATLGQGGHAEAFLERYSQLFLIGVDADESVLETARQRLARFVGRVQFVHAWFRDFFSSLDRHPDLALFDLGISTFHYVASGRGFSFDKAEPLDMRLDEGLPSSAAQIVNTKDRQELARIFRTYGEERFAWEIAGRIVRERATSPIATASALAKIIASAVPASYRFGRLHPATRSFQALRIAVNGELEQIQDGLARACDAMRPGGRMAVISFHSLEDRLVKGFFREKAKGCTCPPEWPICQCGGKAELRILTSKPVIPTPEEVSANPAARSAKLRVAEKKAA